MTSMVPYSDDVLPPGLRSRFIDGINGITLHILEAGHGPADRPLILLLHGFPELAFSWRRVMPQLAGAGYHVVAPDMRGHGRSGGTDVTFDNSIAPYSTLNRVRDVVWLTSALGYREAAAVVGHDSGSPVAGWCGLLRPDIFRSVAMMSAPFGGPPRIPFATAEDEGSVAGESRASDLNAQLAELDPPRKHYTMYYSTPPANDEMQHCPQGVHDFMRAYYHHKSADWEGNQPYALAGMRADELAKLPRYYVMDLDRTMAETVAAEMPSSEAIAANEWLPDRDLAIYAEEYGRTGYQGGLQGYRCGTSGLSAAELSLFSGRTLDVPSCFISGARDWGNYQSPGAIERMRDSACSSFQGIHFVEGAGHWVQQEQPERVVDLLLDFLRDQD